GNIDATYTVTAAVAQLLLTAKSVKADAGSPSGPDVDFTPLLITCTQMRTPLSRWFRNFLGRTKPALPKLDGTGDTTRDAVQEPGGEISIFASSSVRHLFAVAERWATAANTTVLDEHHLMAAFIYDSG